MSDYARVDALHFHAVDGMIRDITISRAVTLLAAEKQSPGAATATLRYNSVAGPFWPRNSLKRASDRPDAELVLHAKHQRQAWQINAGRGYDFASKLCKMTFHQRSALP